MTDRELERWEKRAKAKEDMEASWTYAILMLVGTIFFLLLVI